MYRVGRGEISFWYDKWTDRGLLCGQVPFVSIHDTQLMLKDILYEGVWHFEKLATRLSKDIQLEMQSIFIDKNTDDLLIWKASNSREYSARSVFQ